MNVNLFVQTVCGMRGSAKAVGFNLLSSNMLSSSNTAATFKGSTRAFALTRTVAVFQASGSGSAPFFGPPPTLKRVAGRSVGFIDIWRRGWPGNVAVQFFDCLFIPPFFSTRDLEPSAFKTPLVKSGLAESDDRVHELPIRNDLALEQNSPVVDVLNSGAERFRVFRELNDPRSGRVVIGLRVAGGSLSARALVFFILRQDIVDGAQKLQPVFGALSVPLASLDGQLVDLELSMELLECLRSSAARIHNSTVTFPKFSSPATGLSLIRGTSRAVDSARNLTR